MKDGIERFNYVLGTQSIGARYRFTEEPILIETAAAILEMGSNLLKFSMSDRNTESPQVETERVTLELLATRHPDYRTVLDMPFTYYHIWAYCLTPSQPWSSPECTEYDRQLEYEELCDFVAYLLRAYSGTGKTFYLGHWEGDWLLLQRNVDPEIKPSNEAIRAMIDGLTVRQKAVDDARAQTPHSDVEVYNYAEVNLVQKGLKGGKCVTNSVLPYVPVDYVSYSAYDSTNRVLENSHMMEIALHEALDYIAHHHTKTGSPGCNVWIGEYSVPLELSGTPQRQNVLCTEIAEAGLKWGVRFLLFWEMYNNEVVDGRHRGFWLIDDSGEKQPLYHTHQEFYHQSRNIVRRYAQDFGRTPNPVEFNRHAIHTLERLTDAQLLET